jgi:hypothetical protein
MRIRPSDSEINRYLCLMLAIGETLVSEEILEKKFVCDLTACKGACCVKGDYGAPLEDGELAVLDAIYPRCQALPDTFRY